MFEQLDAIRDFLDIGIGQEITRNCDVLVMIEQVQLAVKTQTRGS